LPVLNPEDVHDLKFDHSTDRLDAAKGHPPKAGEAPG
jgi:hypothetical protein